MAARAPRWGLAGGELPERDDLTAVTGIVRDAMDQGVAVVEQFPVQVGSVRGRVDFLVRQPDGLYAVCDAKLARTASADAVLQITAYADMLTTAGFPIAPVGVLFLGSGVQQQYRVADIAPVWRRLHTRYERLLAGRTPGELVLWEGGVPPATVSTCGRCTECEPLVTVNRDVLVTMGVTTSHRARLLSAGITTVDALAALHPDPTDPRAQVSAQDAARVGMSVRALTKIAAQAALVIEGEGAPEPGVLRIVDTRPFGLLREPDEGDIFFDFEGDPLYAEPGSRDWGLEYLFGWVTRQLDADGQPVFHALWAHTRDEEKTAFITFIDWVTQRREQYPGMHVYHYAPYETTALTKLAARHGTREAELDNLLRAGVFVDVYAVVRGGIRTSQPSLSIKKLEPFYADRLGALRAGVTTAGDSIVEYAEARAALQAGDHQGAQQRLARLEAYNRYDCASTYHLVQWLIELADDHGIAWRSDPAAGPAQPLDDALAQTTSPDDAPDDSADSPVGVAQRLADHVEVLRHRWLAARVTNPQAPEPDVLTVARMAWAGIDYNAREKKQYWWAHFARLSAPVDEWSGKDTFVASRVDVVEDWARPTPRSALTRTLALWGDHDPASPVTVGAQVVLIYDAPAPVGLKTADSASRAWNGAQCLVTEVTPDPGDRRRVVVTVTEKVSAGVDRFDDVPVGFGPGAPISTTAIDERLLDFARSVCGALDAAGDNVEDASILPDSVAVRLLRRLGSRVDAADDHNRARMIVESLRSECPAVVAVQGPPGAGKTFVASHVIASLAHQGWNIAVVAQSHAVINNVLTSVLGRFPELAGRIAKNTPKKTDPPAGMVPVTPATIGQFFADNTTQGVVVGATAWQLANPDFAPPHGWDVVVIDEAGQYSLANSLAVTHAADRVLLLGDPQQLPQVSQGTHPEPINESALSWLVEGHPIVPEHRGFFLDHTWRMHPDLTYPVSVLSYDGQLQSVPLTSQRALAGVAPGVYSVPVPHTGNVVASDEEAHAITQLVASLCGRLWREHDGVPARALTAQDIIVVAPYNAQVHTVRAALDRAGYTDTRVGTVDKFQGQEAPVAIVTLTASSADDAPRGIDFVRNRNRINVSISRGQHSAFLVHSPALLDALPGSITALEEHGAFLRLVDSAIPYHGFPDPP